MTCILTHYIRSGRPGKGLYRALAGAFAIGLGFAGARAEPAAPAPRCSAEAMTVSSGFSDSFSCTRNCVGDFPSTRVVREFILLGLGATAQSCVSECELTPGCTAVAYTISVAYTADGTYVSVLRCTMYSSGPTGTYDYYDDRPGRQIGICNRIVPPPDLRGRGFQTETDRFRPDTFRPSVPYVVNVPGGPNRK